MDAYYGNHFTLYTYIKLCCIPETYTMLYANFMSIKLKEKRKYIASLFYM